MNVLVQIIILTVFNKNVHIVQVMIFFCPFDVTKNI